MWLANINNMHAYCESIYVLLGIEDIKSCGPDISTLECLACETIRHKYRQFIFEGP